MNVDEKEATNAKSNEAAKKPTNEDAALRNDTTPTTRLAGNTFAFLRLKFLIITLTSLSFL